MAVSADFLQHLGQPHARLVHEAARLVEVERARAGRGAEETLAEAGLIRKGKGPAKLLANGEAAKGFTVRGIKMSAGAKQKIEAAGGRVEN